MRDIHTRKRDFFAMRRAAIAFLMLASAGAPANAQVTKASARTAQSVLADTTPSDWLSLDPENTLYVDLAAGRVVIAMAPTFAPNHVANVKALVREGYFDGLPIVRVVDNWLVEWHDATNDAAKRRPIRSAKRTLPAELDQAMEDRPFIRLPDGDLFAPEVGWSGIFPVARDPKSGRVWMTHCYGTFAAGRDDSIDSSGGTDLFVVIGQAPRFLDRNDTVLGMVVQGMPVLSSLTRGTGTGDPNLRPEQYVPITGIKVAADVPEAQRVNLQLLRSDSPAFAAVLDIHRHRNESSDWYKQPTGKVELCGEPIPARAAPVDR